MGEGTHSMTGEHSPDQIEHEVEVIRDNMTGIVSELDRRRHELTDWRLQLERHKELVGVLAGGMLLLLGGVVALGVHRKRRRRRPDVVMHNLGQALTRIVESPEKVARPTPSVANKILSAAGSAAASFLVKLLIQRVFEAQGEPERS